MKIYFEREKNCEVPEGHIEVNYNLSNWVRQQRTAYKQARIPLEREKSLNALGFIWDTDDFKTQIAIKKIQQFYNREGHSRVYKDHIEDDFKLGGWVRSLRGNKRQDRLAAHYLKQLEKVEFDWHPEKNIRPKKLK